MASEASEVGGNRRNVEAFGKVVTMLGRVLQSGSRFEEAPEQANVARFNRLLSHSRISRITDTEFGWMRAQLGREAFVAAYLTHLNGETLKRRGKSRRREADPEPLDLWGFRLPVVNDDDLDECEREDVEEMNNLLQERAAEN